MLVVPACLAAAFLMGLRVNMTPSLPRGLYIMSGDAPARGDTVGFCLTGAFAGLGGQRGYLAPGDCASGFAAAAESSGRCSGGPRCSRERHRMHQWGSMAA